MKIYSPALSFIFISLTISSRSVNCSDAKKLYDDLLANYNSLVRPVMNSTDKLNVKMLLKLSQLIDVVSSRFLFKQGAICQTFILQKIEIKDQIIGFYSIKVMEVFMVINFQFQIGKSNIEPL